MGADALSICSVGAEERSLDEALALGPELLRRAQSSSTAWIAASIVAGPAVVLGAVQRAGRVLDLNACGAAGVRVLRRSTTGTAAYLHGKAILWTLALHTMTALSPDTTARTLLNRNVRGFLRGFRAAGVAAQYFGREWIALRHRPGALLGFNVARDGAVLLEVIAGYDAPISLPDNLTTPTEREVDRLRGKPPVWLGDIFSASHSLIDIAQAILDGVALQADAKLEITSLDRGYDREPRPSGELVIKDPLDPIPAGFLSAPPRRAPIGWIEAAARPAALGEPARAWVGGDVLAPLWALDAVAVAAAAGEELPSAVAEAPIEGATAADLREAVMNALGGTPATPA